jgi:penicillin-binding protein 2
VTVRIPSVRGEIRDRNGVSLVQNRASYQVDFYLPEMVKGYRQRVGQPPITEYRATINGMPKDLKEPDIVKIVNEGVVPRLDDLNLARDYNANKLQKHFRTNTEVPFSYMKDIDFETMAKFSEHDVGLPAWTSPFGRCAPTSTARSRRTCSATSGPPDETNKEEARKFTFYQGDVEGKSNIEKAMDDYLKGKPGIRYMKRNAKGTIEGVLKEEPPQAGGNVVLTVDARIQMITEEALRAVGRGAAVVVDPNTGDILAMASVPSFNPNTFIPSIKAKDWEALPREHGESAGEPRHQRLSAGVHVQARDGACGIAQRPRECALQLRRRCRLRESLLPMPHRGAWRHTWRHWSGRRAEGLVQFLFLPDG